MIRLHYWFSRSGRAEQIRLVLAELGLPWEEVDTEWGSDAWRALSPDPLWFGAQPAIVDHGFTLTQSGVIVSYLARKHGLAPAGLEDQARADAFTWAAEDLRMNVFRATKAGKTEAFATGEWPDRWLRALTHALAATGWLVGDRMTHADLAWWDAIDQACASIPGLAVPPDSAVARWQDAIGSRPQIAAYLGSARRPPARD